jgi:hypothetical protein
MTRYTPLWLQAGSYAASLDRRLAGALWPAPAVSGCAVTAQGGNMSLNVAAGQVAVPSQNATGTTLCSSDAVEVVTLTAAPGTNNRIDLVTCHPRGNDLDGGANNDFIFDYVTGAVAASPAAPPVPAGQVALAQVYVGQGVAAVTAGNITDVRPAGLAVAPPASAPRGTLAQATSTVNSPTQTGVGAQTYFSAPAVTVDGTRRIKVTFTAGALNFGAVGDLGGPRLVDGATQLSQSQQRGAVVGGPGQTAAMGVWQGVPAAGTHTYTMQVFLGTGTAIVIVGTATVPSQLTVEDIGT